MARRLLPALAAAGLYFSLFVPVTARQATPASDGAACTVAPLSVDELEARYDAVEEVREVNDDLLTEAELPAGPPADAATAAAITLAAETYAACLSDQNWPAILSLLSGQGLNMILDSRDGDLSDLYTTTPEPPREFGTGAFTQLVASEVSAIRVLADGRVGAIVVWEEVGLDGQPGNLLETNFQIFVNEDGKWLFDEEIVVRTSS